MPTGPGGLDSNGIWQFGEDDSEALASDLLNLGMASVSDAFTNLAGILQVLSATISTAASTSSTSFQPTGLAVTITPSATSSKVLILAHTNLRNNNVGTKAEITVFRGTTSGTDLGAFGFQANTGTGNSTSINHVNFLDSPSTTSPTTYTLAFRSTNGSHSVVSQVDDAQGSITIMEIAG